MDYAYTFVYAEPCCVQHAISRYAHHMCTASILMLIRIYDVGSLLVSAPRHHTSCQKRSAGRLPSQVPGSARERPAMGHGRKPNIAILVLVAFVWVQPACLGAARIKHPAGKQHACFLASPHHAHIAGHTRGSVTAKGRPEPAPQRTLVRFPLLSVLGDTFKNPWCGQTFTLIEDIEHGQDRSV